MKKVKIVAEIGCNHNGDIILAKKMIETAKNMGASAVKFQMFIPENLVSYDSPKAQYQIQNDGYGSQLEMLKKLELSKDEYMELKKYAEELNIEIFSTAFDIDSIDFLYSLGQRIWKIPSGEITNLPYIRKIVELPCEKKEIILSTGMSTLDEILFVVKELEKSKNTKFTILHCNTQYPTEDQDMNLYVLKTLKNRFPNWHIGLSDHSEGIIASIVAVGIGAEFIEKHFTLDKTMSGPDHKASITPQELKELCLGVNRASVMLGTIEKKVTNSEKGNKFIARKSIVAKCDIKEGEIFTEDNITCKRPGNGISPIHWYELIGKSSSKKFKKDELIRCDGFDWEN
ncbi:N-acetylneuraminate synthase [Clostridium perfringens]|uniref:N-acetylneuraminate synthase n=1 Tax=Clostridium perfringens TaxID=1502 RepID=UPI0022037E26|nr:N-acetylneuraminate synthase [Clostridium perfringens]ELC8425424.1 N-acetylneuraminate synthase [Clostridium perfringens]ELC8426487.1 N-acetylneuraminate synthase [Clostridium perfringens]MDK0762778.1 N-acetylneuraminate synthase [Clostridium perfringens]MDM0958176.1 N-acetylneuraminate synthase [Clostridium perfringens]MDM1009640.1 N-acetylneuraminate synthase [Clostridium perfringens]